MELHMPSSLHTVLYSLLSGLLLPAASAGGRGTALGDWPCWRGPAGDGHSTETGLPVKWEASSVRWKVPLRGWGQSSPVVSGDRIFLTTALDEGRQRVVFCLDRRNGKWLWEDVAWTGEPEKSHKLNGWASATCASDGQIVVAFFGKAGLHAYTVEGKRLWSRELGLFEGPWGTAACPVIVDDLVIQNGDSDRDAFLAAFHKKTGEVVWRVERPVNRGWSTPIVVAARGRRELVLNGHTGVLAYDPATGKELWFCKSDNGRGEPTVTPRDGLLYVVNGLAGHMYAVRPGGDGDVTGQRVVWQAMRKGGRDLPSPIVVGDCVVVMSMGGIATCYDRHSGAELWKDRFNGTFTSSPIAIAGLAYFQDEAGETVVLQPGPEKRIVARNRLGASAEELFRASLTPAHGQIFSRSDRFLYCVGNETADVGR
jgi:hypothetical protein